MTVRKQQGFRSKEFLRVHIKSIFNFYAANVRDPEGGFHQNFFDDGSVFDESHKHLVSSTRMIFNYSRGWLLFGDESYRELMRYGLEYLDSAHWDPDREAYHWTMANGEPADSNNYCYGLAFVILAYASALQAGEKTEAQLDRAFDIMERRFWQPLYGVYADEANADWSELLDYRGQNANMHACEALLAAYDATGKEHFLDRAYQLAEKFAVELAGKADGLIWEHYDSRLNIDWHYNENDPKNLYKPWGFQPGHQTEWTKLLLTLYQHRPEEWMLTRARALFNQAMAVSWDHEFGGIYYGFAPDERICDDDKYFWVQAETFAAAARLAKATGADIYWDWYDRIWSYANKHFIDHENGAWYRVLTRQNAKYSNQKSIAGGKCDYHTLGACWDVLQVLGG